MKNATVKYSYITSMIATLFGTYMKITHVEFADVVLSIGLIAMLIFMITAIIEVHKSMRISFSEKFMWGVGFVFFSTIAGFVYLTSARKRIVK